MSISKIPEILITIFAAASGSATYVALSQSELPLFVSISAAVITMAFFVFLGIFFGKERNRMFGGGNED